MYVSLQASVLRQVCRSGQETIYFQVETSARVLKVVFVWGFLPGKDYNMSLPAEEARSHSYQRRSIWDWNSRIIRLQALLKW